MRGKQNLPFGFSIGMIIAGLLLGAYGIIIYLIGFFIIASIFKL